MCRPQRFRKTTARAVAGRTSACYRPDSRHHRLDMREYKRYGGELADPLTKIYGPPLPGAAGTCWRSRHRITATLLLCWRQVIGGLLLLWQPPQTTGCSATTRQG